MSTTASDDIPAALQSLLGDTRVLSSEDMVVALSQAILLSSGFEFIDHRRAWNSPGLPQAHCAATFTNSVQPGAITEIKWVALGANVMMLAVGLDGPNAERSGIKSIQISTRHVVLPDAEFPFSVDNAESLTADLGRVLTGSAIEKMTAAIRSQLMSDVRGIDNEAAREALSAATRLQHANPPSSEEGGWGQPPMQGSGNSSHSIPPNPANVGRDDLNPLGHPFGRDMGEGGGMVVGPGHPMFRQGSEGSRGGDDFGRPGLFGGPQTLPPGSVPTGARFDPIGPFGQMPGPARPQGGFPGRQGPPPRGSGGPGRLFSGEPDPDAAEPPNSDWNYYM
ncbi:hypothetical protein GGH94_001791 [Coemansia aciculifera]|uniref:PI31 proteasome regulator C-terminal domain-containing protein n=1 Tax=Coemansia aciculifera TaxID=417176 RepID=A0A9W8M7C3_9FUNG|nr:hypothetical protein GGH94_001791 [Coemansia aciculifera]